jgi:hypothetical protein
MEKLRYKSLTLILIILSFSGFSQSGETITGQVKYHGNTPMPGVNAYLNSSGTVIDQTVTNSTGTFTFNNVDPGTYTISFDKQGPPSGVNLTDAFLVMLHIFNLYPFNDIQALAADVNGSGTITWADYNLILFGYLNLGNPFPIGNWVFEEIEYTSGSRDGVSSKGSSSGDASGTFVPTKSVEASHFLPTTEYVYGHSASFLMDVRSSYNTEIGGLQLKFSIPDGLRVTGVQSDLKDLCYHVDEANNSLTITWLDNSRIGYPLNESEPFIRVAAEAGRGTRDQVYAFGIMPESHFIDPGGEIIPYIGLVMPQVKVCAAQAEEVVMYPNPCRERVNLEFFLTTDSPVVCLVYDQCGRLVTTTAHELLQAGPHKIELDLSAVAPGTYIYRFSALKSNSLSYSGTLIKSK